MLVPFSKSDILAGNNRNDRAIPLFQKLLIANRAEIACRIIRTARRLNIPVATVHSEADRDALHTSLADQSVYIGPSRPSESYLNVERIMEAAREVGADALHPGYGFLSENSALAEACENQGIEFVGPSSDTIAQMASKANAARIAIDAGVPVLPGSRNSEQDTSSMIEQACTIGFPVLLKAAAGGGGRAMSIVHSEAQLKDSLQAVRSQAKELFADDFVIIEKYLNPARHIEVQVLADKQGNVLHLFDRDCSAQRRYQKIVEEAPAPDIKSSTRRRMYEAAVSLTKALDYFSAGTIEFLLAEDEFYFMEMNTRLQVEHPVTEMVTGVDLVELQLRVAAGDSIAHVAVPKSPRGHSVQARIYAESPAKDFLPSPGDIQYLQLPLESDALQVHTGIRQGDRVDQHYDPLIAKLVVHDSSRSKAIKQLQRALEKTRIIGVDTNIEFLSNLLLEDVFDDRVIDIKYVENHWQRLSAKQAQLPPVIPIIAALYQTLQSDEKTRPRLDTNQDVYSPWGLTNGWRLNSYREVAWNFEHGEQLYNVGIVVDNDAGTVRCGEHSYAFAELKRVDDTLIVTIDGERWCVPVVQMSSSIFVFFQSARNEMRMSDRISAACANRDQTGSLAAPLPGRIARVMVNVGDLVTTGQELVVIEAMKMEHQISSPIDGIVTDLPFSVDQLVDEGASCAIVEPADTATRVSSDEHSNH